MALFGTFAAIAKGKTFFDSHREKGVCPRDEIADPPGRAMLPIDIHGFAEDLVSFSTLCGVQSSLVRFAPNRAIAWGPPHWQMPLDTLCFSPAIS